jgi:hypothetical protein
MELTEFAIRDSIFQFETQLFQLELDSFNSKLDRRGKETVVCFYARLRGYTV